MDQISPYAKAVVAGLVAALTAFAAVLSDGITVEEIVGVVIAGFTGSGLTYAVPNSPRKARDEAGDIGVLEAVVIVFVVIVILVLLGALR